jgi:hypothetical protein
MAISKIEQNSLGSVSITTAQISNASVTPAKLSQPLTSGTAVASTSGTAIDFTGIPSWVKRITVMFNGVSTNGTSPFIIQLGDSGGIENTSYGSWTGYVSTSSNTTRGTNFTTGFGIVYQTTAADPIFGNVVLTNLSGNIWLASGTNHFSSGNCGFLSGNKTLSETLDRLRITTVNGTDTFDAGSINILYE